MSPATETLLQQQTVLEAVASDARAGLLASPRTLSPWLFYDEAGSRLFEQITALPEYYPTRTERAIFVRHAEEILSAAAGNAALTFVELGAGTASKTGILLRAAVERQGPVLYQPVDVSQTCLDEARDNLEATIAGLTVRPQLANYTSDPLRLARPHGTRTLALYIGSSIGNFAPQEALQVLRNLRSDLRPGDALLLGTDLVPGPYKDVQTLVNAYDDAEGVTAAFNRNILHRLNRELGANFNVSRFAHRARWNLAESRIEMHLESLEPQRVVIPSNSAGSVLYLSFAAGETIHTENSYKFSAASAASLLASAGFKVVHRWTDPEDRFAVSLAAAV